MAQIFGDTVPIMMGLSGLNTPKNNSLLQQWPWNAEQLQNRWIKGTIHQEVLLVQATWRNEGERNKELLCICHSFQ